MPPFCLVTDMILSVNFEHIFFDKYETDKEKEALYIVEKAFKEANLEFEKIGTDFETDDDLTAEKEMTIKKLAELLKREFFVILTNKEPECESEPKQKCEKHRAMAEYIEKNYLYESLTVREICESAGVSAEEGNRIMMREYAVSIREYVRRMRVEKAKTMLTKQVSVEKCADFCGFGSVKTMQRAFKAECGMTPCEWRSAKLDSKGAK